MTNVPSKLKYSSTHEWVREEADGTLTLGITDHAQELLGDLVYVQLPEVGLLVDAGTDCAIVESVKATSDVYCAVSGEIIKINEALFEAPEKVNNDPYGEGWLFRIKPNKPDELNALLDAAVYDKTINLEH